MTKILILIVLFLFLNGCSADTKSGIWDGKKEEKKILKNEEILFKKTNSFKKELNTNIKVNIDVNYSSLDFINNLTNNSSTSATSSSKSKSKTNKSKINFELTRIGCVKEDFSTKLKIYYKLENNYKKSIKLIDLLLILSE